jgi:glycosyltransferase involved in cell wall biosynthesis
MISVVILTKNEENNLLDCLENISWADEIIIVDDNSEDRTVEIAKSFNHKNLQIVVRDLSGDFAGQRNYGLTRAKNEWVMFVDADERVSPELRNEINDFLVEEKEKPLINGMLFKRLDVLWGKLLKHGETGSIKLLRLARKKSGAWQGKVHEQWQVEGRIDEFENSLIHFPHQTVSEFLSEINLYTTLRAKELQGRGEKVSAWQVIFYPKAKFIVNYFGKLGFLDGIEGFIQALFMSFHSFLVRAKLWTYLNK